MRRFRIGLALLAASASLWSGRAIANDENPAPTPTAKPAAKALAPKVTAPRNPTPTPKSGLATLKSASKVGNANDEALDAADQQRKLISQQKNLRAQQTKLDEKKVAPTPSSTPTPLAKRYVVKP